MATKPAPPVTADLSKEIPCLMAKYNGYFKKSNWDYIFNYPTLVSILEGHNIHYTEDELVRGIKNALGREDIEITIININGKFTEFGFKLTKNFVTKWTEPGH